MIVAIRCLVFRAVSSLLFHIGTRQAITSAVVTASICFDPMTGSTYVPSIERQASSVILVFYFAACIAITVSAARVKDGTPPDRSATGSMPWRAVLR